jgi:hypothetical protein
LPRRDGATAAFVLAVDPQHLARRGVRCHDRASRAGDGVDLAADHQRCGFELIFRTRAQVIGLQPPGDFELAEVTRVDLVERRVPRVGEIRAVCGPFPVVGGLTPHSDVRSCDNHEHDCQHDSALHMTSSDF